ncbi:MAG: ABC transporter substrate-binding protein [Acidimicrobiia bacterium]|nr:ABC transporter substrate-binding protein [Acidimicrobiia bacterium]
MNAQQGQNGSNISAGDGTTGADQSGVTGADTGQAGTQGSSTGGSAGSAGSTGGGGGAAAGGGSGGGASGPNTASDVGVTPTSIKIGNITSIQGQFGPDAFSPSLYGLQAFASSVNAQGGINGRKLTIDTCDDKGTGDGNLACAQQLVDQDKIFAYLANNSQASSRSANYNYTKGVPDLGFPLNNGYQKYPTMFDFYANNGAVRDGKQVGADGKRWQTTGQYRWFKQNRGITKTAVFFFNIAVSQQQGYAYEGNLQAEGMSVDYEGGGSHSGENFAAPSFDTDVVNMKQKGVQGMWDAMDVASNQKLCQAMDRGGFTAAGTTLKAKVSTIEAWSERVGTDFSSPCRSFVYSQGTTDPYSNTSDPVVAKFRGDFAKYQPGRYLHQWATEGWAMGYEFQKAAETMGANLTRKGFMAWLNNLNNYTLDGFTRPLDYKPKNFSAPTNDCFSIVQWQDQANTFATLAPITTCYPDAKWVGATASDDGS